VRARGAQLYTEVYDVLHPAQPLLHPRGLRTVPYHQRFEELGAQLTESAGWERALWFGSNAGLPEPSHRQTRDDWSSMFWSEIVEREHHATRTAAGLFDLTPFTKVEVEGAGAVGWLNRVCASEMDRPVGRVVYTTDPGRALVSGRCADIGAIVMQQMRGLAARAPYFSNGGARTLRELVDYYDRRFDAKYTEREKQDLVNFLGVL